MHKIPSVTIFKQNNIPRRIYVFTDQNGIRVITDQDPDLVEVAIELHCPEIILPMKLELIAKNIRLKMATKAAITKATGQ